MRIGDDEIAAIWDSAEERCSNWPECVAEFEALCKERRTAVVIAMAFKELLAARRVLGSIRDAIGGAP